MAKPDSIDRFKQAPFSPPEIIYVDDDAAIKVSLKKAAKELLRFGSAVDNIKKSNAHYASFCDCILIQCHKAMSKYDVLEAVRLSRKYTLTIIDKMEKLPLELRIAAYRFLMSRVDSILGKEKVDGKK
jgi:hypothetical protein